MEHGKHPYYDEEGILHYPIPKYDKAPPSLTPKTKEWFNRLNEAADEAGMTPEERAAYSNIDISGTFEVQPPEVQDEINQTIDKVITSVDSRRKENTLTTQEVAIARERSLASSLHGHSDIPRLVSTIPPLSIDLADGRKVPLQTIDSRILGDEGAKVIWEQEEFLRLNQPLTSLKNYENESPTITLAKLEEFFVVAKARLRRHMGDFISARSVVGDRSAVVARVSYAFHQVDRYFICFFLRLVGVFPESYIGKDPFVCSTGWEASSRVIAIFYKCNCK
ncbi:MAG: hypothetical protein AB7P49_00170 [Bdellovibrionales bacterium]